MKEHSILHWKLNINNKQNWKQIFNEYIFQLNNSNLKKNWKKNKEWK